MIYTIKNDFLTVEVNDFGGELYSIKKNGQDYLHNGDERFWAERSPILFPICGRLFKGYYTYKGGRYDLPTHGFARTSPFTVVTKTDTKITLSLKSDEKTKTVYPFDFELLVTYQLNGNSITTTFSVICLGEELYFSIGAHPGFKLPIDGNGELSDCYIEFEDLSTAKMVNLSKNNLCLGNDVLFENGKSNLINSTHPLLNDGSIFLYDTPKSVSLKSTKTNTVIRVDFNDFNYIGFWHTDNRSPFICIEPWLGLPSFENTICDMENKKGNLLLKKDQIHTTVYTITIE